MALQGLSVTIFGLSGCLGSVDTFLDDTVPDGVENVEFTVYNPGTPEYKSAPASGGPPEVKYVADSGSVKIMGKIPIGSPECNAAELERVEYKRDEQELTIVVRVEDTQLIPFGCTGAMAFRAYHVHVSFKDELPRTVTASEQKGGRKEKVTVKNPN